MALLSTLPVTSLIPLSAPARPTVRRAATCAITLLALFSAWLPAEPASAGCETLIEAPDERTGVLNFGRAVALDGDLAVVGAEADSTIGAFAGTVFVFERNGASWSQVATLVPSDAAPYRFFGSSVDLEGDLIAVGSRHEALPGQSNSGAVYVFRRNGAVWTEEAMLTAPDGAANHLLGTSIAISGNRIASGAPGNVVSGPIGAVHVFEYDGATWAYHAGWTPPDSEVGDEFGWDIALEGDQLIVGAYRHADPPAAVGAAYVYAYDGVTWVERAKLTATGATGPARFGWAVALSGDTAVVGAPDLLLEPYGGISAAFVYRRNASDWILERTLIPADPPHFPDFGTRLALDGDLLLVADRHADSTSSTYDGAVSVYDLASGDDAPLTQLYPHQDSHQFGSDIAVSGEWALVGTALSSGPAYLFPILAESADCNANGVNDACDLDCDANSIPDACDGIGDCNGNAVFDSCDIAIGQSEDCDGNSVPDECDFAGGAAQDCNADSIPDACNIATADSSDCNLNAVPDECDIAGGLSTDCSANGVPDECEPDCNVNGITDECDITDGASADCNADAIPDECQPNEDCNANGVTDICDIGTGAAIDCNANLRPDDCDIADGVSTDDNLNGIPDECQGRPMPAARFHIDGTVRTCTTDADCIVGLNFFSDLYCVSAPPDMQTSGTCYVPRNKYISIDPNPNMGNAQTARRVSLLLDGGGTTVLGWIGEPAPKHVSGGPFGGPDEASPQLLARIEADPHYRDWAVDNDGLPWVSPTVHLGDCEIVPGHSYHVQSIPFGMNTQDEANYSAALVLPTVSAWGDVTGTSVGQPPDRNRNWKDISAVVRGFQGAQRDPKVWLDLQGSGSTPFVPDFTDISMVDIIWSLRGFQGESYPWFAPLDCPDQLDP